MEPLTQADIDRVKANPFFGGVSEKQIRDWHNHRMAMENRFKGHRKNQNGQPFNPIDFISMGGMQDVEYVAASKAAEEVKT